MSIYNGWKTDKDIVAKLREAVEQLTKNTVALTAQPSDSMKINLEMAKKLNLKSTQAQAPEDKRLAEKVREKADF